MNFLFVQAEGSKVLPLLVRGLTMQPSHLLLAQQLSQPILNLTDCVWMVTAHVT
jgi:hypothetical protein